MADYYQKRHHGRVTVLCASMAAIAIGGSLLGMMGFSLLASATLLLVCSPLLLLFSPLLLGVAFVFVVALAGFAVAAALALMGVSALGRIARETRVRIGGFSRVGDSGQRMKGKELDYWNDRLASSNNCQSIGGKVNRGTVMMESM